MGKDVRRGHGVSQDSNTVLLFPAAGKLAEVAIC